MIPGLSDSDPKRLRAGLVFLVMGVLLMLWAWGSWLFRSATADTPGAADKGGALPAGETVQAVQAGPAVLLLVLFLVLVFLFASYAIVRSSRRFRELIFRKRPPPTASDDVWAMHKPPPHDA
jgi:hypothetical protein